MPPFNDFHAFFVMARVRVNGRALGSPVDARPDAIPRFAALGVMDALDERRGCGAAILTLLAVIPALSPFGVVFAKIGIGPVPDIHPHPIVPALVKFHSRAPPHHVVVVGHESLHGHGPDKAPVSHTTPTIVPAKAFAVIALEDNRGQLFPHGRIGTGYQKTRLVSRGPARNDLGPIPRNKGIDPVGPRGFLGEFHGNALPSFSTPCRILGIDYGIVQLIHGLQKQKVNVDMNHHGKLGHSVWIPFDEFI